MPCERCYEQPATLEGWLCDECGMYHTNHLADALGGIEPDTP